MDLAHKDKGTKPQMIIDPEGSSVDAIHRLGQRRRSFDGPAKPCFSDDEVNPRRLIGDKKYDSEALDHTLAELGIEMIPSNRINLSQASPSYLTSPSPAASLPPSAGDSKLNSPATERARGTGKAPFSFCCLGLSNNKFGTAFFSSSFVNFEARGSTSHLVRKRASLISSALGASEYFA